MGAEQLPVRVGPLLAEHWPQARVVFEEGIASGHATFEPAAPSWAEFDAARLADHRLVALGPDSPAGTDGPDSAGGAVLGWAAVSATSSRPVYAGVVEHSVYVAAGARGRGVGGLLLAALVASTERAGIWTLQAGVFPENAASLALHRAAGFTEVGLRRRPGRMRTGPQAGAWRDVLLVERRSSVAGRD